MSGPTVDPARVELSEYAIAGQLLALFVAELATTRAGSPEVAMVHPGSSVPGYGCGVAAVLVPRVTVAPGGNQLGRVRLAQQRMVHCRLSMSRCYPTPERNAMPAAAVLDSAARDAIDDLHAMRTAVARFVEMTGVTAVLGDWTALDPRGGIFGGELTVQIAAVADSCPPDTIVPPLPGDPRA